MENKVKWIGGKITQTLLGEVWVEEPSGATIRVILWQDYNYEYGKYFMRQLLHDLQDELLIIESGNDYLINTKAVSNLVYPPRPSWFSEAVVPVKPVLLEVQCYLEPEDWFYTIGLDLTIMASDFPNSNEKYDAFVIHASEDKKEFVRPLVYRLRLMGFKIWFDEFEMKVGDSIRQTIDKGLSQSEYGIAVISQMFLKKKWPQYELNGLITKEMTGKKAVLPVWYDISFDEVVQYSQSIADKNAAIGSRDNIEEVANAIAEVLRVVRR